MPHRQFQDVHCHYAKITVRIACPIASMSEIPQCYDHCPLDNVDRIGFQPAVKPYRARAPRRKVCDLEKLEPLNARTRAEMSNRCHVLEQVALLADARERHARQDEEYFRAKRRQQYPVPPYDPIIRDWISSKSPANIAISVTEVEIPMTPKLERKYVATKEPATHYRVRWAPDVKDPQAEQPCPDKPPLQPSDSRQNPEDVKDTTHRSPPIPIPRAKRSLNLTELARAT